MSILSDRDILEHIKNGQIIIENYSDSSLTPNGYDLRISEVSIPGCKEEIKCGVAVIPPKSMFYVSTVERIELPGSICAQLWLRTSWIRKGILSGLGKVDAGFCGTLTFMGYNVSNNEIELKIEDRFVQIVFETLLSPASLTYEKRSGNYQGQNGITLSPVNKI